MHRSALPWIILAAVLLSAVLAWLTLTRGAGPVRAPVVRHLALSSFHELEVGGAADVVLVQGSAEAIDVDDVGRSVVEAHVTDGRLVIRARDRRRWWNHLFRHEEAEAPTITLHIRNLDRLLLTGTVNVTAPRLQAQSLHIGASGGTTLAIEDLVATTLRVDGSGALNADLGGRVDDQHVSISGAGTYNAARLKATNATVSVSGVGNVIVNAERTLKASISGAGVIEYLGDPQVTENVSGLGRVRRRDAPAPGMRVAGYCNRRASVASASLNSSGPPVSASMSA
jgi:hypothetical protein